MNEPKDIESGQPKTAERLTDIAVSIGFVETSDLVEKRNALKSAETIEIFKDKLNVYLKDAEDIVGQVDDELYPKAQIGLILTTASIYYSQGLLSDSSEAVKDAWEYAYQIRDEALVSQVQELWFSDPKYTYKRRFP